MRHVHVSTALLMVAGVLAPRTAQAYDACAATNVSWDEQAERITVAGPVGCTLSELHGFLPEAPLTRTDEANRVWYLAADLILQEGATLVLEGGAIGGDVDELRLKSSSSGHVEVTAQWGTLLIRSTRVTSWNERAEEPDTDYRSGRAFVRVISFLDGDTPRTSHMEVTDSDIGYLGYYAAESYGLVWKVRGETTPGIYDLVDVTGGITNSVIHHNYFGVYTFGAYGMHFVGNEIHDNVMYGLDPHDDSDALVVEDNYFHDNGAHGFICSMRCDNLEIRGNTSVGNAGSGFMLHRAVVDTIVEDNVAEANRDAGFALFDSYGNTLRNNVSRGNAYGLRLSVGAAENLVEANDFSENTQYGIYFYRGSDPPTVNDGRPVANVFVGNQVRGNVEMGVRATDAVENRFEGNVFADNGGHAVWLLDSPDNVFAGNDLGGSELYVKGRSTTWVEDTDVTAVMLGGAGAEVVFNDVARRVFDNDARLPTLVEATKSSLTVADAPTDTVVRVAALELGVESAGGAVEITPTVWGPTTRVWRVAPGAGGDMVFTLAGLAPRREHAVWVDGVRRRVVSDALGNARFGVRLDAGPHRIALRAGAGWAPRTLPAHPEK